jgi:hypothetical protein
MSTTTPSTPACAATTAEVVVGSRERSMISCSLIGVPIDYVELLYTHTHGAYTIYGKRE